MKLKEVLEKSTQFLKAKGFETPRLDAELLISGALDFKRIELYTKFEYPMSESEKTKCREMIKRRQLGEPVAYILGYKDFYKNRFQVGPGVLVPRPETEHLVDFVLDEVKAKLQTQESLKFLELGVGSGCIGLTLLSELPKSSLIALDISEKAMQFSKNNAAELGVLERVQFENISADQFTTEKKFDFIVSNPPYIDPDSGYCHKSVKEFEPHEALFAEDKGLRFIKSWAMKYKDHLKPGGHLAFEIGSDQGELSMAFIKEAGLLSDVKVIKDYSGNDRVLVATKKD